MSPLLVRSLGMLAVSFGLLSIGCAGAEEAPPPPTIEPNLDGQPNQDVGPCEEGTQEECTVTIHQANGQKSCFTGARFCVDGEWSDCLELEETATAP